jgi:hypothetical protein
VALKTGPKPKLPGEEGGPAQVSLFGDQPAPPPAARPVGEEEPFKAIYVHFETWEDYDKFQELLGVKLTSETKAIWYPRAEPEKVAA